MKKASISVCIFCLILIFASASVAAQSFPVTVTDSLSRTVVMKTRPARILSLSPANTEILFAVGAGDRVVGVTTYCNYPAEAADREKVGGFSAETMSVEKILSLRPDLIVSDGAIHRRLVATLESLGLTVYAKEPVSFADTCAAIEDIGALTGNSADAAKVAAGMKAKLAAIQARVAAVPQSDRVTVFWEVFDEPLMTAGRGTFVTELLSLAGGTNIFGTFPVAWPQISEEEVLKANPAVIMGGDDHGEKLTVDQVKRRPGWARIDAVVNGRVYLVNADIVSRAGPRLAEGVEAIARALYPKLF
jgi:iron complex transport system substrate-binding protein